MKPVMLGNISIQMLDMIPDSRIDVKLAAIDWEVRVSREGLALHRTLDIQ